MRIAAIVILATGMVWAQDPNPTQKPDFGQRGPGGTPIFRVTVVSRTVKAVNYHHRSGTTHIDFRGTELMPQARGEASVQSQMGSTRVDVTLNRMTPAGQFGPEFMTYVLWGITPEGRAVNLGEVVLEGDHAKVNSATDLQTFGLIVTAEPYFSVTQPSDVVVAENFLRNDTSGTIEQVDAKYELLQRGQYVLNRSQYLPVKINPKGPLQLAEAENAIEIAKLAGAGKYAADTMAKAELDLRNAQGFLNGSRNRKESETDSREAAQMAEDARLITIRKIQAEERAAEQAAREKAEADRQAALLAQQQATEQAKRDQEMRAKAEADRQAALQAQEQAQQAAADAAKMRADAEAARAAALAQQQAAQADAARAKADAENSERARQQAEAEKTQLRERLRQQLNTILETRETQRGLIVNISDVLFDFNKYTLKPGAREKLAKVSGILLAYPGLKIQLEGYTDSIGSDEYNMTLSRQRADGVRTYVVGQGVPADTVTAVGMGKANPVADNSTSAGRQQNRRVEMIVSGAPIGIDSGTQQ